MTTKHQPATPLPWTSNHDSVNKSERIITPHHGYGAVAQVWNKHNAEYLWHAANAYPKLVEALRAIAAENERNGSGNKSLTVADADILLRELGEDK